MPIGPFERDLLLLLSVNRNPDSYIGGATVFNRSADSPRTSEAIDLFHDSEEALRAGVSADLHTLKSTGYDVSMLIERPTFHRALVKKNGTSSKLEWVQDSAYRFFPIESDPLMGFRLHHLDAATNKVLAGVGRAVIRDYVDLIHLHTSSLPLGALIWAGSAKDPGLNPDFIRSQLSRTHHYDQEKYDSLKGFGSVDPVALKKQWIQALSEAERLFDLLLDLDAPLGCFFLDDQGVPQTPTRETFSDLHPHFGSVRGCWPRIVEEE